MAGGRRANHGLPRTIVALEVVAPSLEAHNRERVLKKLSRDFSWALDDGWSVEYWGLRRGGPRAALDGRVRVRGPRLPWLGAPVQVRVACSWIVHFALALRHPDTGVVTAPAPWSALGVAAARRLGVGPARVVVRIQGSTASKSRLVHGSRLRAGVIAAIERFVLRQADLVVPMGRFTRQIAEDAGVAPDRIVELVFPTIWGGASPVDGGGNRHARVVCAARFEREKGIDVLLRAWSRVVAARPQAQLTIAGDGPQRVELERLVHELGVEAHVSFTGWLPADEMPAFFGGALVAVLPSRWEEGLGMVLVEAGLAGCDLVGSDLGGIRDMIEHGVTGRLVAPDDPGALAAVLEDCLARPEAAAERGAAARRRALDYLARRDREMAEFRERFSALASPASS